jgi:predicted dehydrogenase
MDKVRIGIIGIGQIGKHHLRNYREIPDVEVVAACDLDSTELRRVSEEFEIPQTCTDYRELLRRDDLVAVDVCLHNNLHMPLTVAALEAGKHVYCEKPIAGSYIDGKAMVERAAECGRMLHIQLATLYSKETKAARILIEGGQLGRIYHARSTGYRRRGRPFVDGYGTKSFVQKKIAGGGALLDMGVYHVARMLYLIGSPGVQRVSGKIYQETEIDSRRRKESGYDVEEMAVGLVRFEDGLSMDIIESWAVHLNPFEGSSVVGSRGGIRLDPFSFHTTLCDLEMDGTFNLDTMEYRRHQLLPNEDALDSSQRHWIAALQGRVDLLPTAELALKTMLIQEGIYLSDRLGREVTVEEAESASLSSAAPLPA